MEDSILHNIITAFDKTTNSNTTTSNAVSKTTVSTTNNTYWNGGYVNTTNKQWVANNEWNYQGIINTINTPISPYYNQHNHNNPWILTTSPIDITITDENGAPLKLGIAEVSRYYSEALEYRRIKRFARIFPAIRELLNELIVAIKLIDPLDDDELVRLENEIKNIKIK